MPSTFLPLSVILLAAGLSSRIPGKHKLLLPFRNRRLMEHPLRAFVTLHPMEIIVVTGYRHGDIGALARRYTPHVVYNPLYSEGMASSIRVGVEAARTDTEAFVISPADLPCLKPMTLMALVQAWYARPPHVCILRPVHEGRPAHPVFIEASLRADLLRLTGDTGARSLLQRHANRVQEVPVSDPGVWMDIDTLEDYRRLRQTDC